MSALTVIVVIFAFALGYILVSRLMDRVRRGKPDAGSRAESEFQERESRESGAPGDDAREKPYGDPETHFARSLSEKKVVQRP